MAETPHKSVPNGILNSDDDYRVIPPDQAIDKLNCRALTTEQSRDGGNENTRGNTLISHVLPAGTNKTIGKYEDDAKRRIVYFNYNSNGNHGIYQYFLNTNTVETILVEPILGFDVNHKITGINIVDHITGDMLYWTDNNKKPRKINIDKANETNKHRKFNIYLIGTLTTGAPYTTTVYDPNGIPVLTWSVTNTHPLTLEDAIEFYLTNVPANNIISVSSCHQFLTVEMSNLGAYTMTITVPAPQRQPFVVANNFYPQPFKEEFIDAIKYPTECQPLITAKQDTTRNLNLIQNKIFQFRTKIVYDDYEKSVWSPYSEIADLPISCNATSTQSSYNYIEIDFNSGRLFDLSSLANINRIEIAVREHNNDKLRFVKSLDKYQFLGAWNTFNFYNDEIYPETDPAETGKNYDSLPLLAKSQEFATNRIFYGGLTEGYDPTCVDAKINLSLSPNVNVQTYSFTGRIYINNLFTNFTDYNKNQPIHNDGNGYVFGGISLSTAGQGLRFASGIDTDYKQTIPLGGFVAYLAGTNHYAISKQPKFAYNTNGNLLTQDGQGVIDTTGGGNYNCNSANARNERKLRCAIENTTGITGWQGIYSEFTISGVRPGKYILRIASHLLTASDITSSLNWQKTSTYTISVAGSTATGGMTEAQLEIAANGDIFIDGVQVGTANGTIPTTHIADLTDPDAFASSIGIAGYVTDADTTIPPVPSNAELMGDTRIDLARVNLSYHAPGWSHVNYNTPSPSPWNSYISDFENLIAYTDHNGFFWWASRHLIGANLTVNNIQSTGTAMGFTGYTPAGAAFVPANNTETQLCVWRAPSSNQFNNNRTIIDGTLSISGQPPLQPASGINIITTRGGFDTTDNNGQFNLIVYGDTRHYNSGAPPPTNRADNLNFAISGGCIAVFNPDWINYNIAIDSGNYTYTNHYSPLILPTLNIMGQGATNALKRGGKYKFGFVYFDEANRDNNVSISEALELKIPFYTEQDVNGNIYGGSAPIVEIEFKHQPPSWATHYQIVRTLNGNQSKLLQWTAKSVTYIDDDGNSTSFSSANRIKIDLEGTLCYKALWADSKISYSYDEGDRLVLIKDANGNFYNQYFDFKIRGVNSAATLILYVDNLVSAGQIAVGSLFEIYNPTKQPAIDFYYEIGQCYPIVGGLHTANTQNQQNQTAVLPAKPAKATLTNGDTYYRLRSMPYASTNTIGDPCDVWVLWSIEDYSISDFYKSNDQSIGRIHVHSKDFGQKYRPSAIRFSGTFIPETKVNNLNSFEGLNEKVLPIDYGLIQKLILTRDVLCSIHNNSQFVTMYLGKQVMHDNALQSVIALSEQVIQKSYQYQGGLGTQNPESVIIDTETNIYGYDNEKGIVWVREVNGLYPISELKYRTYWRNKSAQIKAVNGTYIYGGYDNRFNQYVLAIEGKSTHAGTLLADTIAFNKSGKGWESRYSFHPDYVGGGRNNVLVTFKNGQVYRHDSNTYNNFYGVQYPSNIKICANTPASLMKVFLYLSTESKDVWATSLNGITTLEGQVSDLIPADFELIESVWRASLLKDKNTPNIVNPLIDGDDLRSSVLILDMENTSSAYTTLFAINVYSNISQSTNK